MTGSRLRDRLSPGVAIALAGLALAIVGFVGTLATASRWASARALLAESPAAALPLLLLALGLLTFVAGLTVYVFAPARSPATAGAGIARLSTVLALLAVAAIPANVLSIVFVLLVGAADSTGAASPAVLIASIVPLEAMLLGVLYLRIIRPRALTWRDLGFSTERLGRRVAQGAAAWILILVIVFAITVVLDSLGIRQTQSQIYEGVRAATPGELLGLLIAGGVIAPIAEEAFFRGYVFTAYRRTHGRAVAYALSAGLFAVVHLNLPALPAIFAIGLGLAYVFDRTKSLVPGIVAHGLNNSLAFITLFFAGAAT